MTKSTIRKPTFLSCCKILQFFDACFQSFSISFFFLVEDSPNEDNDDEDETGKETETSGTQSVASLQAFHALGCELTDISKSVLLAEGPVVNLSAAEPYVVLKVTYELSKTVNHFFESAQPETLNDKR